MKRALAERAKQSAALPSSSGSGPLLQVPVQTPLVSSSGVVGDPVSPRKHSQSPDGYKQDNGRPLKIPRRDSSSEVANHSSASPASHSSLSGQGVDGRHNQLQRNSILGDPIRSSSDRSTQSISKSPDSTPSSSVPSNAGVKRQRPSSQPKVPYPMPSDDETEDNQQSSFFLKHQNRALASELKSLQHQLTLLEGEREYRRNQCRIASQALNSLQATWTQMETELQQPQQPLLSENGRDAASFVQQDAPMSTGTGSRVEIVGALFDALAALAKTPPRPAATASSDNGEDGEEMDDDDHNALRRRAGAYSSEVDPVEKQQLDDLSSISWNILQRANTLEEWIRKVLQKMTNTQGSTDLAQQGSAELLSSDQRSLLKEVGVLRGQCREYKVQIAELAKARDDTTKSERKVRRSIYRLSTGRVKIEQVLKDIEKSDEDGTLAAEARMEVLAEEQRTGPPQLDSSTSQDEQSSVVKQEPGDPGEVQRVRGQLEELERQLGARDSSIEELQSKLTEREQRINTLCSKGLSDADAEKVQLQQKTEKRLEQAEAELADLQERLTETRENWAKARGDADAALKSLDELQAKQKKRWAELTGVNEQAENSLDEINIPINAEPIEQARRIIELDHKLKQALENVRQADAVRQNLREALAMNSALQAKLDEVKGKYATLQAGRSNSNAKSTAEATNHGSSSRDKGSSERADSSSKAEKLHRENRRMRKEIAALSASKESAKSKLERVEKERDMLTETNARLLKQSAEKDDMNAKSLSTILHLKNLTENLTQGKASLEQQVKSAKQLALAARLATNAKDRVAEEVTKEKEALETRLSESEGRNQALKKELENTARDWSEADAKISSLNSQLTKSTKRSDELVSDLDREHKERRKLQDSLDVATRKAADATEKLNEIAKQDGGKGGGGEASSFTVDQLNTQVSVLKGRLACPVCHYRDKDCIIMRCRHMFCKHCVDENIQNRSRKCPSCGLKFSEKDVEDVWL